MYMSISTTPPAQKILDLYSTDPTIYSLKQFSSQFFVDISSSVYSYLLFQKFCKQDKVLIFIVGLQGGGEGEGDIQQYQLKPT